MQNKRKNDINVPLFESFTATTRRAATLPDEIMSSIIEVQRACPEAAVAGDVVSYLLGESDSVPTCIEIVVHAGDAEKLGNAGGYEEWPEEQRPPAPEEAVMMMNVTPQGEASAVGEPVDDDDYGYDENGVFTLNKYRHVPGKPSMTSCDATVCEASVMPKTMPIAVGGMTLLAIEPGVYAQYKAAFAKMKGKCKAAKAQKVKDYDAAGANSHVKDGSGLADVR